MILCRIFDLFACKGRCRFLLREYREMNKRTWTLDCAIIVIRLRVGYGCRHPPQSGWARAYGGPRYGPGFLRVCEKVGMGEKGEEMIKGGKKEEK